MTEKIEKEKKVRAPKKAQVEKQSAVATVSLTVRNADGKEVGSIDVDASVFGIEPNATLVHDTVRWQLARRRSGTHQALTRSMKLGGAKKPFKQKHTGRARAGSSISPLWVGGASVHGPLPRDYDYRLPKRTRRQALASVLSDKVLGNRLVVVDKLAIEGGKTRGMIAVLRNLGINEESAAIVLPELETSVTRASGNIENVLTLSAGGANVYDLVRHSYLVCTTDGVKALEQRVKQGNAEAAAA